MNKRVTSRRRKLAQRHYAERQAYGETVRRSSSKVTEGFLPEDPKRVRTPVFTHAPEGRVHYRVTLIGPSHPSVGRVLVECGAEGCFSEALVVAGESYYCRRHEYLARNDLTEALANDMSELLYEIELEGNLERGRRNAARWAEIERGRRFHR